MEAYGGGATVEAAEFSVKFQLLLAQALPATEALVELVNGLHSRLGCRRRRRGAGRRAAAAAALQRRWPL